MNWRRGLFRFWLTASVLWIVGWPTYVASTCVTFPENLIPKLYCRTGFGEWLPALSDLGLRGYATIVSYDLGPPLAVLLIGVVAAWVISGFQR